MRSDSGSPAWVVLKFGGTSVSNVDNWRNIARVARDRAASGVRVLIVHSALSGITDRLERLLESALTSSQAAVLDEIEERHRKLAIELGVQAGENLQRHFDELRQIAAGIGLVGEISDRTRARVMAAGELMATELGARFLSAQGLEVTWADARTMLHAADRRGASEKASILSATCNFAPDLELERRLAELTPIVITQGFIASDSEGSTVLLGRGGSDTSAAYFAAKLRARGLEIWTDVPGMFSANPRSIPSARLLKALHYDEAQEIATNGAKVLHPRCILPARQYEIPLSVHDTRHPDMPGTVISSHGADGAAQVKAVCVKKGITLVALDSPGMWHQVGFLADAFQIFKDHGISVDLVSTSETNVTVSLDPAANSLDSDVVADLVADLGRLCRVQVIGPCASVSLVGRNIRGILHQLGEAFELFAEQRIYLVSQAANDLNFTFVVDQEQADRLVDQLHELLVRPIRGDEVLGPTWQQLFADDVRSVPRQLPWWRDQRAALEKALGSRDAAFVYHRPTIAAAAKSLTSLAAVDRVLFAMKANPHPDILRQLHTAGVAFECVSRGEVERAIEAVPGLDPTTILYTPNFASRGEYEWALTTRIQVTVDNTFVLREWPALFRGRDLFIRIDSGKGRGHHSHVRTAGDYSKFGVPLEELDDLGRYAREAGARIVGLHAHPGSGVFDVENWRQTATLLAGLAARFRDVRVIDVGGGLGVPDSSEKPALDLAQLDTVLGSVKRAHPELSIWIEPGRYLVANAGVLLARVTQTKRKGDTRYVGIATGMNSLIRPALYGAYHEIVNLSRLDEAPADIVNVVGPICESADVLGHDRLLPQTCEGDLLLIATAGAYGRVMGSSYNLRGPAEEVLI